jgi:hypothetical protein
MNVWSTSCPAPILFDGGRGYGPNLLHRHTVRQIDMMEGDTRCSDIHSNTQTTHIGVGGKMPGFLGYRLDWKVWKGTNGQARRANFRKE